MRVVIIDPSIIMSTPPPPPPSTFRIVNNTKTTLFVRGNWALPDTFTDATTLDTFPFGAKAFMGNGDFFKFPVSGENTSVIDPTNFKSPFKTDDSVLGFGIFEARMTGKKKTKKKQPFPKAPIYGWLVYDPSTDAFTSMPFNLNRKYRVDLSPDPDGKATYLATINPCYGYYAVRYGVPALMTFLLIAFIVMMMRRRSGGK